MSGYNQCMFFFARDGHHGACIRESVPQEHVGALKKGNQDVLRPVLEAILLDAAHRKQLQESLGIESISALVLQQFLECVVFEMTSEKIMT